MKRVLLGIGVIGLVVVGVLAGAATWAISARDAALAVTYDVHEHTVAVPFPLTEQEIASLRVELGEAGDTDSEPLAGVDLDAIALERALARGQHLVESRYPCADCHGEDFSGGVMVDAFPVGSLLGPNLTGGSGSAVLEYDTADWERLVRHGVLPDGRGALMPSQDFMGMSDRELSDIIAWIRSRPPVDNAVPPSRLGPLFTVLYATGEMTPSASTLAGASTHPVVPPPSEVTVEFGAHLAQVCVGCHRQNFEGGPIVSGDPSWPPTSNLTSGEGGVIATYDDAAFAKLMRTGVKPDGEPVQDPMRLLMPYAEKMTDTELKALFTYIRSLPPRPTGT